MHPFRDATAFVQAQADAVHAQRLAQVHRSPTGWRSVYVRRRARVGAALAVVLGAVVVAAVTGAGPSLVIPGQPVVVGPAVVTAVALLVGAVVARRAARRLGAQLARALERSDDPGADLVRWRREAPEAIERRLSRQHERASWGLPLAAATVLAWSAVDALGLGPPPSLATRERALLAAWMLAVAVGSVCVVCDFPRHPGMMDGARGVATIAAFVLVPPSVVITGALVVAAHRWLRAVVERERAIVGVE